jgi:murein DD-endopeptidase MepM/ murein hydrolase activator NlpD
MLIRNTLFGAALFAATFIPATADAGRIIWPASGRVTSDYGPRESPCGGCSTFHHGIDIGLATGTNLGSPGNGTVTSYAFDSCAGNLMKIGYGGGWETRFLHLSARVAAVGAAVSRNTTVARSGGTGSCTTGPHLHFEVRKDGASQLVPGSVGTNVTRNTEVPREYPGLNDPSAVTVVVDNTSGGFAASATWATSTGSTDKYGADYRFRATTAVSDRASWTASLSAGTYTISAWWPEGTNRSPTAPYTLPDGALVNANQQTNGGQWNVLGTKSLSGSATTYLSCWTGTGFVVIADAVRYAR